MWVSESFATLELLLGFLNDRGVRADRCKVFATSDPDGGHLFHLLFQPDDRGTRDLAAVATAEYVPLEAEPGDVLDAAEAIIHDAQIDD